MFWPWVQTAFRGRKFEGIIRRELEEVGPYPWHPVDNRPWWEHASKRFVHEEIFARAQISANRDFLLSLNPTVVYRVSQVWMAFGKRDGDQWLHFLRELASDRRVGSERLRRAVEQWEVIMAAQPGAWRTSSRVRGDGPAGTAVERSPHLFERRLEVYAKLLDAMRGAARGDMNPEARATMATELTNWYYSDGAGLLLSGRSLSQFLIARASLESHDVDADQVRNDLSWLRTELKVDLGVRQADERHVVLAQPEDERRW